jgi:hypothetical protein
MHVDARIDPLTPKALIVFTREQSLESRNNLSEFIDIDMTF